VLYGREELLDSMEPYKGGGEMISAVWLDQAKWNELPYKFEAGTPNIAGAVGLGAAVDYLETVGMEAVEEHERQLSTYALERLNAVPGVRLYGPDSGRGGVFSFNLGEIHAHDVAQFVDSRGVAVRAGHHCAHPLMRKLGVPSTVRASLYLYNSREDIDRLCAALADCGEFFGDGV
jgi:cysteine desulfurase/selenocysteine lyase